MNVIHAAAELNPGLRDVCVAIGVFDGVHLGHQSVIASARQENALSVVITFDRHPNAVVAPQNVPPLIYPLSKKLRVIESLGMETAYVIHFDKPFSEVTGENFIRGLVRDFKNVRRICVGETFMFGCRRSGNVPLLKSLGEELAFSVHALPDIMMENQPVSSTRIRNAIRAGDLESARQMLGRPYALCGPVVEGARLGRKLGFPTANVDVGQIITPPSGVYAAKVQFENESWPAAVNIGHRPTVHSAGFQLHVEAHLLDFAGDIYGRELEITFLKKLRDEQKFNSTEELRKQIAQDIAQTRAISAP